MAAIAAQEHGDRRTARPGKGFERVSGRRRSTSATSSSRTTTPYDGDESFLAPATTRTTEDLGEAAATLFVEERRKGVLDVSQIPSSITAHAPGYIDRENEIIVGLQTEAPLKRAIMPNGGFRMVVNALKTYGYEPDPHVVETFTKYRKTHNDGVFDAYTADIRRCRSSHILTGLPDAYGRGRIIGDYRRVALYGVDRLIERKQEEKAALDGAHVDRRDHPRPRGTGRADPRAQGAASRWPRATASTSRGPARTAKRSGAVALLRLPRGGEGAERRRDVARPHLDVPRHLLRARPRGRRAHRRAGAGDHRRLRHQAAHRPVPAHAGIRRALRRRSDLGHRVDRAAWATTAGRW